MEPIQPHHADCAYVTPGEAAAALGVSRRTVSRLAEDGKIRFIRPGAHYRYLAADVEALIAQERWEPAS